LTTSQNCQKKKKKGKPIGSQFIFQFVNIKKGEYLQNFTQISKIYTSTKKKNLAKTFPNFCGKKK